ncbi:CBS domain-containing protein [Halococcus thailandensis]|uniref:CBS domain containing membrane protein n=1 Tax=Halococcus thailandensis JCM 13552 TaxID=1227457 RepID=M0N225_9EURY|nr:CBS domain-containing protein [Halococcus thailandensis]EMA51179.1 CBS domain containing membrane protein [Halococcus thailandensis JCM 13552]
MNIADIATTDHVEVSADQRLGKVRALFEEESPRGLIVTNNGEYAGVITQRSLMQSHVEDSTKANALMSSAPQVKRTSDVRDVARMLVEGNTKVAPVVEGDSLWGIVTADAILEAVLDNLDALVVSQIHTDDVITIAEDASVGQAINRLREHGVSRLPVENEAGYLTGVATTHDLVDFVVRNMDQPTEGERSGDSDRMLDIPVYDLMSAPVETISGDESVREAVSRMLDNDYNGLVVTPPEDDRTIDGVLTKTDVLRALTFTEEDHMDVQITNIDLLDTITREDLRESVTQVADKFQEMQVHHAHVRFHKHKEKLRGTPLIQCQIRLRTSQGQVAGTGEGYGAESAFRVALDKLERNVLERKGIRADEQRRGQILRKLNEI